MRTEFHPFVRGELKDIRDYYETSTAGLGKQFLSDLREAVRTMLSLGARTQPFFRDVHVVRLKRFPYGVFYRVVGDTAYVVVVKHLHRDPAYGLDRT